MTPGALVRTKFKLLTLFVGGAFGLVALLLVLFLIIRRGEKNRKTWGYSKNSYIMNVFKHGYNESTKSVVTLNRKLGDEEYIYFQDIEEQASYFISKSSKDEYKCSGSCYCSDVTNSGDDFEGIENPRRSTTTASQSLLYILSAASTVMALNIAKDLFHSTCEGNLREECDRNRIFSEVNDCKRYGYNENYQNPHDVDELIDPRYDMFEDELNPNDYAEYRCNGFCVANGRIRAEKQLAALESIDCAEYTTTGVVMVLNSEVMSKSHTAAGDTKQAYRIALTKFRQRYLNPFCRETTRKEFKLPMYGTQRKKYFFTKRISLCASSTPRDPNNVHCKRMC